jgi:GPH family glycoside/pentoside/hexuronide:cation symporter
MLTLSPFREVYVSATAGTLSIDDRLPTRLCVGFGIGSLGIAILLNTVTTFFPALMTTVLGQSAGLAGLLLTVSKLYDAVADIAIGMISDRTRSRWGRRRPYLLVGALISGVSFLLIFIPPKLEGAALIWWMGMALIVYSTGYSLFSVPYVAMAGEMTDGYHERTRLFSFRAFFITFGQIISSAGTAALISWAGGGGLGYAIMGGVTGAILTATMIACFAGTRTARFVAAQPASHMTKGEAARALLTNRPFVLLMSIKIAQFMAIAVINTTKLLFLLNVAKVGYAGLIHLTIVQNVVSALAVPLWVRAARIIGKRNAYIVATACLAIVYGSWLFTGPGLTLPSIWWRGAVNGLAAAGTTLLSISMLPDIMEYDRIKTGLRREGIFSGIYTIVEKLGFALGAAITGAVLSFSGYIPTTGGRLVDQPSLAISGLYAGASIIPALLICISMGLMLFYRLDEKALRAMRQ